jgi:hypothetical protein
MHKFNRIIYFILFTIVITQNSKLYSQVIGNDEYSKDYKNEKPVSFKDRIFTGGNLGLQFGNATFIDVSPIIGYRLTNNFAVGLGASYQYIYYNEYGTKISSNTYGGSVFARYYFTENVFAHIEYESLFMEPIYVDNYFGNIYKTPRTNVESYLVGGGYRQALGGRTSLNLLLLWNLNETSLSPYNNPILRFGVGIGI